MRKRAAVLLIALTYMLCSLVAAGAQDGVDQLLFTVGEITTVDIESGVVTPLSDGGGYATEPKWSPDGMQIAYTIALTDDFYGQYGLYVMNADGSQPKVVAQDLVWRSEPLWIDSARLLYATTTGFKGGSCVINSINRDGSQAREVLRKVHSTCSISNLNPALSPDGRRIAFGLDEDGDGQYFQLYTMTLADGQLMKMTDNRANNAAPEWSPDGTQIAYVSDQDKQREIYVMNADSGNPRRLTRRPGNDYGPHWLPDGQHIIFGSDQDGYNIFSLDVTSGVSRNLTNLVDDGAWSPVVSPDGTKIAYLTGIDPVAGADHINIMTLSRAEVHELENVGVNAYGLTWRPLSKG